MQNHERETATPPRNVQFIMGTEDQQRIETLPWDIPLEHWPEHGVIPLSIRRGESRHQVIFVEREGFHYAIKETTPIMAEREINNLREIEGRGIPSLTPIGHVTVALPPILLEERGPGGLPQYMSGDRGYTVTMLAHRVIPHALLYRMPFTKHNKRRILSAIAVLMIELHEHGIYWGDPSLANVLIRIDGRRILAILADAETSVLFPAAISEGLREEDLASFGESLSWQAEDIRNARGLSEEESIVDDSDFHYFEQKYRWLRKEHAHLDSAPNYTTLYQVQRMLEAINLWGYDLLGISGHAIQRFVTVLPGWYVQRLQELLGITVPRLHARRLYNMILGHQAIMRGNEEREVTLEEAATDWYTRYHLPTILLLRKHLTNEQDPMQAYFSIMQVKWKLSLEAGYEIPLEQAVVSWAIEQADTGKLGAVDPAAIASWWREREPAAQALEPPLIESEKLEPLLSEEEQHLVHLPPQELEQELIEILEQKPLEITSEADEMLFDEELSEEEEQQFERITTALLGTDPIEEVG